jgi:hypothetical protein
MNRFGRRTAAVAVATSVALLAGAGAASAQTLTLRDARHDVWQTSDAGHTFTAAPGNARGDVTKVRASYAGKNLVVTQHFTKLDKVDSGDVYTIALRTNTHLRRVVFVAAEKVDWRGHAWLDNAHKTRVSCQVGERINYVTDTVRVSVPATCLKSPRWVQFTAFNLHIVSQDQFLADNPMNTQAQPKAWSPRVHRG